MKLHTPAQKRKESWTILVESDQAHIVTQKLRRKINLHVTIEQKVHVMIHIIKRNSTLMNKQMQLWGTMKLTPPRQIIINCAPPYSYLYL